MKLLGVMKIFIILIMVMILQVYTNVKIYQIMLFKYMQIIVGQLYLNKAVKKMLRWEK